MELNRIIEKAETEHRLTQKELAARIGLQPTALSHVMARRRKLPAEAAIELAELTGEPAKRVWEAAKAYAARAAVVVLACGSLFFSAAESAHADQGVTSATPMQYKLSRFTGYESQGETPAALCCRYVL